MIEPNEYILNGGLKIYLYEDKIFLWKKVSV